jgi:preprotein translocase subunit SecE
VFLVSGFFNEFFRTGLYKRTQGRVTRQVTFGAVAIAVTLGIYRLSQTLGVIPLHEEHYLGMSKAALQALLAYGIPGLLLLVGWWVSYRVVNLPGFADFLIAVEAEMSKVSWPSRGELFRYSIVVLVLLLVLAAALSVFDVFWTVLFSKGLHLWKS